MLNLDMAVDKRLWNNEGMRIVFLTLLLSLAMSCATPPQLPTATPVPFLARQLNIKIDPKEAATYLLNPSPARLAYFRRYA